jgi:hypothetical protein
MFDFVFFCLFPCQARGRNPPLGPLGPRTRSAGRPQCPRPRARAAEQRADVPLLSTPPRSGVHANRDSFTATTVASSCFSPPPDTSFPWRQQQQEVPIVQTGTPWLSLGSCGAVAWCATETTSPEQASYPAPPWPVRRRFGVGLPSP